MLSREEIIDNTKCISLREYSRLMTNEHLSKAAREKCIRQEAELQQLRFENEKLRSIVYGSISEKEHIKADNFDKVINEADVVCSREDGSFDPESSADQILSEVRSLKPNDELDDHVNYLFRAYFMDDDMNDCDECDGKYRVVSMVSDTTLRITGKKLVVSDEVFMGYKCDNCGRELPNAFDSIMRPGSVLSDRRINADVLAYILTQKYVSGRSFKTQELFWKDHGVSLDQHIMSHWFNEACDKWIIPVYRYMKKELLKRDFICADTEGVRSYSMTENDFLFNEDKMLDLYIYRTPENDSAPIAVFDIGRDFRYFYEPICYDRQTEYLKNYKGILQTEKTEHFSIPDRKFSIAATWSRVRKLFEEALDKIPPIYSNESNAKHCLDICLEIEKSDDDSKPVDEDDVKLEVREQSTRDISDYLTELADSFVESEKDPDKKSALGKAYSYIYENKSELEMYYNDARTSINNDLCNDILLDYSIPDGDRRFISCDGSDERIAAILSLIHTIKLNKLDPQLYFTYLFKNAPSPEEKLRNHLMPWNCPECCRPLISQCEQIKNRARRIPK